MAAEGEGESESEPNAEDAALMAMLGLPAAFADSAARKAAKRPRAEGDAAATAAQDEAGQPPARRRRARQRARARYQFRSALFTRDDVAALAAEDAASAATRRQLREAGTSLEAAREGEKEEEEEEEEEEEGEERDGGGGGEEEDGDEEARAAEEAMRRLAEERREAVQSSMRAQYEDYRQRFRRETRRLRGECAHLFAKSAAAEAATRAAERALARSGLVARSVSARGRPNRHVVFEDVADKGGEGGEEAEEGGEEGSAAQDAKEEEDEEDEEMAWAEARSFWRRRLELFSRFGEGVLLDRVGWYSVTPELIARRMAQLCRCDLVVDAMCGVGGNAIQLADTCAHVLAIELDATRLCLARHNAAVYGVAARIDFVCGDAFRLLPSLRGRVDCVLLSPPWGGVGYRLADRLALRELGVDCRELLARAFAATHNVAIVLPFNIDRAELVEMAPDGRCVIESCFRNARLNLVAAYFGELATL